MRKGHQGRPHAPVLEATSAVEAAAVLGGLWAALRGSLSEAETGSGRSGYATARLQGRGAELYLARLSAMRMLIPFRMIGQVVAMGGRSQTPNDALAHKDHPSRFDAESMHRRCLGADGSCELSSRLFL